ncbi:MAG: hypothetical protein RJA57_594 [Bacteroidota bacterium]|jgi:hypothetical protein
MRFLLATALFLWLSHPVRAQEEFIEPPARLITSIPFIQLTGGIIILQAQLGDHPDTLHFILDTGSSGISLDSTTAEVLGEKPEPTERSIRGIGGIRKVPFLYNRTLHFPGLQVDSLNFHINDYTFLTAVYGEDIDGIIGYAILSRYIVRINYDSARVSFYTPGTIRYPRGGHLFRPEMNQLVSLPLRVRDERAVSSRYLFDIGAGLCVLFSKEFAEDSNLIDRKRKRWPKEGEGLGGKIEMEQTVVRDLRLGPYRFRNVPVFLFDDKYNVTAYPNMGGILGNDLLRRFNVLLNYPRGDIHLTPNSHFFDPFDYSYSGMELYYVNGRIVVGDLAAGGPAEAAGIRNGDEVIAINKTFNQTLNQYKIALQHAGDRVRLILRRDGRIFELEFKIRSILNK